MNSKKTETTDQKDLNKSDEGNLHEPITKVIDYGEIPENTPKQSEDKE